MMFKHLGMFVVLAVCLFAMAIVGCDEPMQTPIMKKLAGTYWFVSEDEVSTPPDSGKFKRRLQRRLRDLDCAGVICEDAGKLHLRPGGNSWLIRYKVAGETNKITGSKWHANDTHITFRDFDGERVVMDYVLDVDILILIVFGEDRTRIEKWVKD